MRYKSFAAIIAVAAFLVAAAPSTDTKSPEKSTPEAEQKDKPENIELRWNFGEEKTFSYNYSETLKMNVKGDSDAMGAQPFDKNMNVETSGKITMQSSGENEAELDINLDIKESGARFGQGPSFDSEEEATERKMKVTGTVLARRRY